MLVLLRLVLVLLAETLVLAVWTITAYFLWAFLFERLRPPGYEAVVIQVVQAVLTATSIVPVCWVVLLHAVRSVIQAWDEFHGWFKNR